MAEYINRDDMTYLYNNGEYDVYSVPPDAEKIEIIRCKDCKYFEHEIHEELTVYGFYNIIHSTFCTRLLETGDGDVFDVNTDDSCSFGKRKEE